MKRIYTIILAAAALFAGCEEFQPVINQGRYPDPEKQRVYTDEDFDNRFTKIADLKDMYTANGSRPYVVDRYCVIKGQVTTSDQVGNLYKSLYIQDETAGIEIKIGKNGLYNEYKLGQWLYIDCSGLTIGDYNGMINLGYQDPTNEYETAYLEHAYIIDNHVFKGAYAEPVKPIVITEADLHKKVNLGRLVTIENLKYDNHIFLLAYVDPNGNRKDNGNRIFIDEEWKDNYGVNTWACSESKWKEYLYAGCFDGVEAPDGTVGTKYEHYIEVNIANIQEQSIQEYITSLPDVYENAINAGKIEYSLFEKLIQDFPEFIDMIGKSNLIEKNKGYKELVGNPDDEEYIYHIGSMAYSISQYFKMGKTAVQVRSSGYARFADVEIPSDVLNGSETVTFTGILTDYKGEAQFTLIDLSGVKKADGSPWYDANNKEIK